MRKMQGIFIEMYNDKVISAFGTTGNGELIPFSHPYTTIGNLNVLTATVKMLGIAYQNGYYIPWYHQFGGYFFNVYIHQIADDESRNQNNGEVSNRWKKYLLTPTLVDTKFLKRGEIK